MFFSFILSSNVHCSKGLNPHSLGILKRPISDILGLPFALTAVELKISFPVKLKTLLFC